MDVSSIGLNALYGQCGAMSSRSSDDLDEATNRLIEEKDKDGNGTLSAVEISISDEAFKLADANSDGELDADELKSSVDAIAPELKPDGPMGILSQMNNQDEKDEDDEDDESPTLIEALFTAADRNGDGSLSEDELSVTSEEFDAMDTNQDGVVSYNELLAAGEATSEKQNPQAVSARQNLFEQLFSSESDDDATTETAIDQIA